MAQGDGKVPINESALAGYRFMASSLPVVFPAAALLAAISAAAQALIDPIASPSPAVGWALLILAEIGSVVYAAFLLRLALREDASGFFGLQFGADEVRMLGVAVAVGFLFFIIAIVGVFAITLLVALAAMQSGAAPPAQDDPAAVAAYFSKLFAGPSGIFFLAVAGLFIGLLAWVGARLSLVYPATIGERRMMAFSTFSWTRGNALRIVAVIVIVALPLGFGAAAAASIVGAAIGAATGDVDAVFNAKSGALMPHALFLFAASLAQLAFLTTALMGAYAYLYRGLRPPGG